MLFVTIAINNYNYRGFLSKAIDSALEQSYAHTEVIVVDDKSTDGSQDIIKDYGDHIIPVFHAENGKQGAAFNSGFAHSKGDIIIFLDADDYLYPSAVERIVEAWKPGICKIHYRLDVVDEDGNLQGFSYPKGDNHLATGEVWRELLEIGTYVGVPTSGNAISRKVLDNLTPIPKSYNTTSDDYLSVLVPLYGEVLAINEPLGAYRIHSSNQWALTEMDIARFRRFIQHDQMRCLLLKERAPLLGYQVPDDLELRFFGRIWSRLVSLKLDTNNHPIHTDTPWFLVRSGIYALWHYSEHGLAKRVLFSFWFIWVAFAPKFLAKPAVTWFFVPHLRPKAVRWAISKVKALTV